MGSLRCSDNCIGSPQWLDRYIIYIFERISGDGIFVLPLAIRSKEHE